MKVSEHINRANGGKKTLISFEFTPPKRGGDIKDLLKTIEKLNCYNPGFIHVTSRRASVNDEEQSDGTIKRKVIRPRPATDGLCARIQAEYGRDTVIHSFCLGVTQQETEDFLINAHTMKIENIFAIRGDETGYEKELVLGRTENKYASDLIKQISNLNNGKYLDGLVGAPTDFCIGGACYPEKHFSAPNIETDLRRFKEKQDAGMDFAITQMFFDNNKYFDFIERCTRAGITIPIIPGITTVTSKNKLDGDRGLPGVFNLNIPYELTHKMYNATSKEDVRKIGIDYTVKQAQELIDAEVPSLHFFVYDNSKSIIQVCDNLNLNS